VNNSSVARISTKLSLVSQALNIALVYCRVLNISNCTPAAVAAGAACRSLAFALSCCAGFCYWFLARLHAYRSPQMTYCCNPLQMYDGQWTSAGAQPFM
jgi:hypothetical protein